MWSIVLIVRKAKKYIIIRLHPIFDCAIGAWPQSHPGCNFSNPEAFSKECLKQISIRNLFNFKL